MIFKKNGNRRKNENFLKALLSGGWLLVHVYVYVANAQCTTS